MIGRTAVALVVSALLSAAFWTTVGTTSAEIHPRVRELTYVHDFLEYYLPNAQYLGARLREGALPLWNPQQALGAPFLAVLQPGVLYPPNWLHAALPSPLAFAVEIALHLALAAAFAAALARALGASAIGAALSGFLYATAGTMLVDIWQPPAFFAAVWLPAVWLASQRAIEDPSPRRAAALGAALAMQILAGWPYAVALTALACSLHGIALLAAARRDRARALRGIGTASAGALLGGLLAAPLLLPAVELVGRSVRAPGSIAQEQAIWVDVAHDPAIILPQLVDTGMTPGIPGMPSLALALVALVLARGAWWRVVSVFAIGCVAFAASFPDDLPVYGALRRLPLLGDFRFPFRYRVLTELSLAVLAGVGVGSLQRVLARWPRWGAAGAVLLAAVAAAPPVLSIGLRLVPFSTNPIERPGIDRELAVLAGLPPRPVPRRVFWSDRQGRLGAPADVHVAFDLEPLTLARTARVLTYLETGRAVTTDHKLRGRGGAQSAASAAAPFYGHTLLPRTGRRAAMLDVLSADFIAAEQPPTWLARRYPRVSGAGASFALFANPRVLPRAYLVYEAERAPGDLQQTLERLVSRDFDRRRRVLLDDPPPELGARPTGTPATGAGALVVEAYEAERVRLRVRAERAAVAVLTDVYYPGWRAKLDGEAVPVLRANGAFRGVLVPAGEHVVELRYVPTSFRAGIALATMAVVATAIALRRRRTSP